ncbi:hypothetical protein AQI96_23400 [Streptomyces canus]|nr:hypothetical protein AQI96_23400 [Streptomyces canus]
MKSAALESLPGFSIAMTVSLTRERIAAAPRRDAETLSAYPALSVSVLLIFLARSLKRSAL